MTDERAKDLKEQLKRWQHDHAPPPSPKAASAKKAPPPPPVEVAVPAEPPRPLTDRELFEQAVADMGDGAVAILEKYGHGHLSGEGEPEPGAPGRPSSPDAAAAEASAPPKGGAHLGEAAMFLDAVAGARPLGRDAARDAGRGAQGGGGGHGGQGNRKKPKR